MLAPRAITTLALSCLLLTGHADSSPRTTVQVPGVGEMLCNVNGDGMTEALGIPFAAAPVDINRFKPPQPAQYNGSKLDATAYGPACMQAPFPGINVSEDCLTLNIWTPETHPSKELMRVFFWIHGGAFIEGSGMLYNGSKLSSLGLVAVSINYRLGVFGWFPSDEIARENPHAPGNGAVHGFLDQLAALKWVRAHIEAFGGDMKQITIAGESAGSLSVCAHLHLPTSKGLFHRAIMESGSCVENSPWAAWDADKAQATAKALARVMNAPDLASLRRVSAAELMNNTLMFGPTADGWFMQRNPSELPLLAEGMDIIIGSNSMDTLFAPPYAGTVLPDIAPQNRSAYESLVTHYFGKDILAIYPTPSLGSAKEEFAKSFYQISSDVCNTCPKHNAIQKFRAASDTVYAYEFAFATSPLKGLACHGCEINDVFNEQSPDGSQKIIEQQEGSFTASLGKAMSRYWASFVKDGRPLGDVAWPAYEGTIESAKSLDVLTTSKNTPQIVVARGLASKQCKFFQQFLKGGEKNWHSYRNFCSAPTPRTSSSWSSESVVVI